MKVLAEVRERYPLLLVGYVVMPEHMHLLIYEKGEAGLIRIDPVG